MSAYRHARLATDTAAMSPGAYSLYAVLVLWAITSGFVLDVIGWIVYWIAIIIIADAFIVAAWISGL